MKLLIITLAFLTVALSASAQDQMPLKILTYNVLVGFDHGKSTRIAAKWIKEQQTDLVALQELRGITQKKLDEVSASWGHPHAVILKENGFPVGLTSKSPIEVIEKRVKDMWHGYLHCKVRDTHLFVVHLSPSKHTVRVQEAELLATKIQPLLAAKQSVIVLGDFNCNSPLDREWLEKRPSTEGWRKVSPDNADPNYLTMTRFRSLGLTDLVHLKQTQDKVQLGTFPTRIKEQSRPGKNWRIDFILTDPALAQRCTSASTPRDPIVHKISDHFPVVATFGVGEKLQPTSSN